MRDQVYIGHQNVWMLYLEGYNVSQDRIMDREIEDSSNSFRPNSEK